MSSVSFSSLLIAAVAGVLFFFGGIAEPTIFRVLPREWAGRYVRTFFPRHDMSLCMALAMAALLARDTVKRVTATICALVVFFSWKVLAPAINRARDQGDDRQFDLLHRASVLTQEADRQSDLLHRASVLTNVGRLAALLWAVLRPG